MIRDEPIAPTTVTLAAMSNDKQSTIRRRDAPDARFSFAIMVEYPPTFYPELHALVNIFLRYYAIRLARIHPRSTGC
jgi:hypothetical protein